MRRPNLPLWLSPIWTHSDLFCSAWTSWNWLLQQHNLLFCCCDISIIKLLVTFKYSLTLNCIIALFSLCESLTTSQTLTEDSLTEYFWADILLINWWALPHESWWFFTYPGFLPETGTICELRINDCGRQNPTMTFNIWEANNRKLVIAHFSHV